MVIEEIMPKFWLLKEKVFSLDIVDSWILSQWECELSNSLYGEIENSPISRSKILNLYSKWLVKKVLLCCEHDIFISLFK